MSRILITGGAGFIGSHVSRAALAAGHGVRIFDNLSPQVHGSDSAFEPPQGMEFIRGDVTVRADWQQAIEGIDTVVHLAAETGTGQSMYEIDRYYRVNVQGTALLFDILANAGHGVSNVVLASSRAVYGEGAYICRTCDRAGMRCYPKARSKAQLDAKDWTPKCPACGAPIEPVLTREDDQLSPASIYAATKAAQEQLVRVACQSSNLAYSILRLQNVFGEGQSLANPYTGILSIFSNRIRLGKTLPIFEDGAETRDFIHVDDVARAILRCVERPQRDGATLNIGSGKPIAVLELAQMLSSAMNATNRPTVTGEFRVGDIRHNFADISKAERLIGPVASVGLESGINRFCNWVRTQPLAEDLLDQANAELKSRNLM